MTNFVLIYTGGAGMASSEEEQQQIMADWGVWYEKVGEAIVDGGNPFLPEARSIDSNGNLQDQPVGVPATGYTVVSAASLDAACAMCKDHPHLKHGGQVSVYEAFQIQ